MILLDAYALIAFVRGEAAEPDVQALLRRDDAAMSAVNLAETIDVLARRYEVGMPRLRATFEPLLGVALRVVPCEAGHGWRAGELRARHYRRGGDAAISLGDCVLLATAREGDSIATADAGVLAIAKAEGIDVIALPDSGSARR